MQIALTSEKLRKYQLRQLGHVRQQLVGYIGQRVQDQLQDKYYKEDPPFPRKKVVQDAEGEQEEDQYPLGRYRNIWK